MNSPDRVLQQFSKLIEKNRLAHAYIFVGPEGVGKTEVVLSVAKLVNCEQNERDQPANFCNGCPACLKINSGNHPDVQIIERGEEDSIKVEEIRELLHRTQLRPFEARRKIFIIKHVEDLTAESANTLLKTLEEPTASSLILLTSSVPEKVLETVKSRCHKITLYPLSKTRLAQSLKKDYDLDETASSFLAAFAEGCWGKAKQMQENQILKRKNEMIDQIIFARGNDAYLKNVLVDKEKTKEVLDVLYSFFRDLYLLKVGMQEKYLIHLDRIKDLHQLARLYDFRDINDITKEIVKTSQLLAENLNVKIAFNLLKAMIAAG